MLKINNLAKNLELGSESSGISVDSLTYLRNDMIVVSRIADYTDTFVILCGGTKKSDSS